MDKTLYFTIPLFGRKRMEEKIINELNAPCYQIVDNTKYFHNNNLWIVMDRRLVTVNTDEHIVTKVKEILYNKRKRRKL